MRNKTCIKLTVILTSIMFFMSFLCKNVYANQSISVEAGITFYEDSLTNSNNSDDSSKNYEDQQQVDANKQSSYHDKQDRLLPKLGQSEANYLLVLGISFIVMFIFIFRKKLMRYVRTIVFVIMRGTRGYFTTKNFL
jgi:hypothetical protein